MRPTLLSIRLALRPFVALGGGVRDHRHASSALADGSTRNDVGVALGLTLHPHGL